METALDMDAVIRRKLAEALGSGRIEIIDDSQRHDGHAGWRPGGWSHVRVSVVSSAFVGKSRVERQRMVYAALAEEMASRIHALSVTARTPEEEGG